MKCVTETMDKKDISLEKQIEILIEGFEITLYDGLGNPVKAICVEENRGREAFLDCIYLLTNSKRSL